MVWEWARKTVLPLKRLRKSWLKRNLESGVHVGRGAIFCCGLKFPLAESLGRVAVEAGVYAAKDADVADGSVSADDGVENHRAVHILAHQFEGVGGIDFVCRPGLGEIGGRTVRCIRIDFGKTDDPASARRVQVRRVDASRIELAIAEDGAFRLGECGSVG